MLSLEIRRKFLRYFQDKGHSIVSSSPVVPHDDPTLLFTNAGMNQFKDVFLGKSEREYTRAATSQKCIRVGGKHNDLDNVGHTSRHLTFFEMLGNFSFGDYFKKEAILFAWEVSTSVFGFPEEKIWPTIFEKDDEAFELWKKIVPEKRIIRFGEKDNFWSMGDTGPCGPCSELLFDRGPHYGTASSPKEDLTGERYLEFWNLVFMQYNRSENKEMNPLPKQSIDTGAGLERIASLKKGVDSVFQTDILRSLIAEVETITNKPYNANDLTASPAYHVIADHIRSLSFAIADGAEPSNTDRGYVLRKLIRRAVRYGRTLDLNEPFLAKLLPRLIQEMGSDYPEIKTAASHIGEVLSIEEENFLRTLKRGGGILKEVIDTAKKNASHQISGHDAFKLKDTYGFPLEEILLIAKDSGLVINLDQYMLLEESAKETSRNAKVVHKTTVEDSLFKAFLDANGPTLFVGYDKLESPSTIEAIIVNGEFVDTLKEGKEGWIILNQTPFYAEKGGQVGDRGSLLKEYAKFAVTDCKTPFPGITIHIGSMQKGSLKTKDALVAEVDSTRRKNIAAHHTATHLLHFALQEILGSHIRQAGSLVEADRLRFDFNHTKSLTRQEIKNIETLINAKVRANASIHIYEMPYTKAQQLQEIKQFFGDKYGSTVRVVDIGFSKELCGGTHVETTSSVGLVRIIKESSIASGVRRIEACVGHFAEAFMYEQEDLLYANAETLKVSPHKIIEATNHLKEQIKQLTHELKTLKTTLLQTKVGELQKEILPIKSAFFLGTELLLSPDEIKIVSDSLLAKNDRLIVIIGSSSLDKAHLFVRVSDSLIKEGISAVSLIKEIAPSIEGSGGGKQDSAQAGGKKSAGIQNALKIAHENLYKVLN